LAAVRIGKQRSLRSDSEFGAAFIQGDAHALPFPDNCFDILVSCETIEHLPSPEEGVREFDRVTRPGGTLLLTTPNYLNLMGLHEVYARFRHPNRVPDQPFDRIQFFFQTRHLLKPAGWKILRSDGFVHQLPLFPARNPVRVKSIDTNPILRKVLRGFAFTYCLVANKRESAPSIL
jgi:SAM-dependent methyltransferase